MKGILATLCILAIAATSLLALEQREKSGAGTFVSFKKGTLTIKCKTGLLIYEKVGANYKTFQNNEDGRGSKLGDTVEVLGRALPGAVFQVNIEDREISLGLDYRVIGTFASFEDGRLNLLPADVLPGFVQKPTGGIALTPDPGTPVLESINGGDYKFAGRAGDVLKGVKKGTIVTARSEYDPDLIEVIQIGEPKRRIERYFGQTRGTVCGTFMSFKANVLRIRGKGITTLAANEYERVIAIRIADAIPILESVDGGEYKAASAADVLKSLKEGEVLTIRKVEEVILDVRIGLPTKK